MGGKRAATEGRKLLLLMGQRASSVPSAWGQTKERPKRDHAGFLHPTRAGGHKTEHLSAVLFSPGAWPARRRGLGFTEDHCQCIAHTAFLSPYIIRGCWGSNQPRPYATAPKSPRKHLVLASLESHIPTQSAPLQQPVPTGTGGADGVCTLAGFHPSPCPGASAAAEGLW